MASKLYPDAQLEALRGFPAQIAADDLARYFTLLPADMSFINAHRGEVNRIGVAVALCTLPWLGFVPDDMGAAPAAVVSRVAATLGEQFGFGGREDIMARLMPQGDCQHSGTYNGHPLVVAAALAAVRAYLEPGFYEHINIVGEQLFSGLNQLFEKHQVQAHVRGLGANASAAILLLHVVCPGLLRICCHD